MFYEGDMMGTEIERKFLVKGNKWQKGSISTRCRQGYLPTSDMTVVRVRVFGNQGFLTIKGKTEGISRSEFEYEIPVSDAESLLDSLCERPLIEKTRYRLDHLGVMWEVDVFEGENKGLVLAEVELEDEHQLIAMPEWVSTEVSQDPKYFNSNLAKYPHCEWSEIEKEVSETNASAWKYPEIDRSDFTPNFHKRDRDDQLDISWGEGRLSDGRPYRVECWAANQVTYLTYIMPNSGIEEATKEELKNLLISEGLINFADDKFLSSGFSGINTDGNKRIDPSSNEMWHITVIVGDEDGSYVYDHVPLKRYESDS